MSTPLIQRPHYFSGEALVTDDFVCEQQYHMTIQSLNNRSLYTYGVARGLDVVWNAKTNANQVEVRAGMAIDRLGQQIILLEPQVIQLTDIVPGATYFLTINYHQVYADYENQTGVAGYKRIVELPQIRYVRNLQDPGLNILLAVIGFSDRGAVNSLTYKSGAAARRYVSSTLGGLTLITEGAGVYGGQTPGISGGNADPFDDPRYPSLRAKKEIKGDAVYLELDATHSVFTGFASTQGNLGVGASQPASNLQVDSITFKGPGTLSSNNVTVTISETVAPFFQVGDLLISDPPVLTMTDGVATFGASQTRTITEINPANNQVTVDLAFDPKLQAIPYTYIRTTLVRFSGRGGKTLFDMRIDGGIDIGVQALANSGTGKGGRGALTITPNRQVGIALTDRDPKATLDVNGTIAADALTIGAQIQTGSVVASGTVYAQSFDGNGSKLKGLPILSYWTRETIGTPTSNLYYTQGNVGILNDNPIASLSVGSGPAFVGKGFVSAISDGVLIGYQSAFSDQIMVGDSITVGVLVEQIGIVTKIIDDEHLEIDQQMAIPLVQSAYRYQSPGVPIDYAKATDGSGTISTNGIEVVGKDTKFTTTMSVGGAILVKRFKASADTTVQTMLVKSIKSQTELTLTQQNGAPLAKEVVFAKNSAYVVSPALLTLIQANNSVTVSDESAKPPPALAITTNGNKEKPNTVAINTELFDIDTDYALQVTGDVNFGTGTLDVDHLKVKTLEASQSVTVASDGTVDTLLAVGTSGAAPLLTVNKANVVVGPTSANYALDAQGVIHASGNLVTGATLQGAALAVAGNRIATNGSTQMLGARIAYDQSALTHGGTYFTETATTDGYVMATVGEPTYTSNYAGALSGATYSGGTRTSFVYATGLSYLYDTGGKKSGKVYRIPVPGAFTMPVRNGERWELTLTWNGDFGGPPKVEFYWIPLGIPPDGIAAEAAPATLPNGGMGAMLDQLRDDLQSGRLRASMEQSAQQTITQRMDDLTRVFGDATGMSPDADARQRFMQELAKIVCTPQAAPRTSESPEFASNVQSLIDVFARVTGQDFTAEQRSLLADGVRALVQINDNDANRHDLVLIKTNVELFLDNVQQVLRTQFDISQRRLLTRALVRLVGDGSAPGGGS